MKKKDLPQDESALSYMTRELQYVQKDDGSYGTDLSKGWNVKKAALDAALEDLKEQVKEAKDAVLKGKKSPIYYFMVMRRMDMPVLRGYTGFWPFLIRRHMRPRVFKRLNDKKLKRYADAFDVTVDELRNFGKKRS